MAGVLGAVSFVDSHTAGEPTRVVVEGGPALPPGPLTERRDILRRDFDRFRQAVICEPRGSEALVGALLLGPADPAAMAGVVFFNNVGYLGMCGHGTIGVVATLAHLGRLSPGPCRLETPAGPVDCVLAPSGEVTVHNVPAYRARAGVRVTVPGHGPITGDVAWGGNWFFLTEDHGQALVPTAIPELTALATAVRRALDAAGITGDGGAPIDHVELFGPGGPGADSRSFVLCPGGAYDRSPCGTGTSAKLACLAAEGRLAPGQPFVAESIIGTRFVAGYRAAPGDQILPTITGRAFVTATGVLHFDPADPLAEGIGRG